MALLLRHATRADARYLRVHYAQQKGGKSVSALSRELGLSEPKVSKMLDQLGLKKKPKVWSSAEIKFLRKNNSRLSTLKIAKALGLKPAQINAKRAQLGLSIPPLWTDEKLDYLKAQPLDRPYSAIAAEVGLPKHCVSRMASVLGLQRENRDWSTAEDDTLRQHHATMCSEELSKLLGRSVAAIYHRASRLKLGNGYDEAQFKERQLSVESISDRYIAKHMARKNPRLQEQLMHYPDLLQIRKQEIILNRTINHVSQSA